MTDRNQSKDPPEKRQGPLGDVRPSQDNDDPRANPAQKPEPPEKRPSVGTVTPADYPAADRSDSSLS